MRGRGSRANGAGRGRSVVSAVGLAMLGLVFGLSSAASAGDEAATPGRIEFVGRNGIATANGTFHVWQIVEHAIDLAAIEQGHAVVEIDLASVDTGSPRRDAHLRNPDFFEVERFPTARVRVYDARPIEPDAEGRRRFAVRYDVDLHGVQKTLEGEITLVSESPLAFEGGLVIDRLEFGVGAPPRRWNPMSIEAGIPIRFRVEL
ncbi:MAG: YceI family protein [Myxococcales bacterium]|nr:YceI family protein [Myxococcales bacterium]